MPKFGQKCQLIPTQQKNHLGTLVSLFLVRHWIKWTKKADDWPKMSVFGPPPKLLTPGQLLGYPWKLLGYNGSNYLLGRSVASNLSPQQIEMIIREKTEERYCDGSYKVKSPLYIGEPFGRKVAAGPFWPCFACPKLGDAGRTRVASKNRAVLEKISRPQFWS